MKKKIDPSKAEMYVCSEEKILHLLMNHKFGHVSDKQEKEIYDNIIVKCIALLKLTYKYTDTHIPYLSAIEYFLTLKMK